MNAPVLDVRNHVLLILEKAGDEGMTIPSIAKKLKLGEACLRPILYDLACTLAIRSTQGLRNVRYWIPSKAQLDAEERHRQKLHVFKPLKINKEKQERYAEIDALRKSISSIG